MRKAILLSFFLILLISPALIKMHSIPSSARSRVAIARVTPKLKKDFSTKGFKWGASIFIRIFKKSKELEIWVKDGGQYRLFKIFKICTYGGGPLGPKVRQGDGQAPEGFYFVTPQGMNPHSNYHLSFNLGYPNDYDRGHKRTGSALMVHGDCVSIGCYAMTDKGIEEIFTLADAAFQNNQAVFRVHIFPFRMTKENMGKYGRAKWIDFWKNLKEGYDFFENNNHNPPNVKVRDNRYFFGPVASAGH